MSVKLIRKKEIFNKARPASREQPLQSVSRMRHPPDAPPALRMQKWWMAHARLQRSRSLTRANPATVANEIESKQGEVVKG